MDDPASHAIAASTDKQHQIEVWSLVLAAFGIEHRIIRQDRGWAIFVQTKEVDAARKEIQSFEEENRLWPPEPVLPAVASNSPPTVLILGGLLIFFFITGPWDSDTFWFDRGALSTQRLIKHGEWWRLITALTLHSNPVHVAGNIIIGGSIVHLVLRQWGSGLGFLAVILSGFFGNLVNILFRANPHISVGFSTAVFGSLGLLAGSEAARNRGRSIRRIFLPLAAAMALLGLLGTEGEHTDLGAHFFGFLAGILMGGMLELIPVLSGKKLSGKSQAVLFVLSLFSIIIPWLLAVQ